MDRNTKRILHAVNPDKRWAAASLTKLATAVVVLDHARLSKVVPVFARDDVGGAKLRVPNGARVSVQDLLAATLIGSANNTANALVRATGHSRKQFVHDMNTFARRVGARQTRFTEPTGIDPANATTARDMANIAANAFARGIIRTLTLRGSYTVRVLNTGKFHRVKNTNKLVTNSPLIVLGGKTGLLDESRYNFVVEVRNRAWKRLVIVIFGAPSFPSAFSSAEKLAAWAWGQ
jgi:D-alanyl-D-alanine carboxypeptidase